MARRKRSIDLSLIILVIGCGLASRSALAKFLPEFLATYAGDTLWALMVFLTIAFLRPRWSTTRVALCALILAFSVEFSQLYQADWINQIRAHPLGALVLGSGFLWSDLVCYSVGILLGVAGEALFLHPGKGDRIQT